MTIPQVLRYRLKELASENEKHISHLNQVTRKKFCPLSTRELLSYQGPCVFCTEYFSVWYNNLLNIVTDEDTEENAQNVAKAISLHIRELSTEEMALYHKKTIESSTEEINRFGDHLSTILMNYVRLRDKIYFGYRKEIKKFNYINPKTQIFEQNHVFLHNLRVECIIDPKTEFYPFSSSGFDLVFNLLKDLQQTYDSILKYGTMSII
eukprot:GHVL01018275.1.p1 GENE.GHVL01018275.1~~GHVL01018275.1.p1  ORF type:complete len:208 (+),score=23.19 GHVL01018275.1:115-738(+)